MPAPKGNQYAVGNEGGRPTKLTPEITERAYEYLEPSDQLPTIEGLAIELDITRDTLYQWEKENNEFSYILGKLRLLQANKLIQKSIKGEYNSTISKMMLTKHGYVEQSATDITSAGQRIETNTIVFKDFTNDSTSK